jgi:CubicO group peptidase (beta-lactamase class C family)
MKKKLLIVSTSLLALLAIYLSFPQNAFIVKALIYEKPDLDDYTIFKNRTIKTGFYQAWKTDPNYNKKPIKPEYLKSLQELSTIAFLVIKDTALIREDYWEGYNDSAYSNSFSVAKSIVSLLIGIALDENKIKSIDEPVCNYLPTFCNETNRKLTIRNLLTMSSGLNWQESYNSLFSQTTKAYYGKNINDQVLKLKVTEQPGVLFKYLSCNTQILSNIIEKATGKSLSEYASEKLWDPLGARHDALWSLDNNNGVEKAYCCFNSNARDFARIGQLVLNKGKWNHKQVISEKYLSEATSAASYLKDDNGKPLERYGYQWWLTNYKNLKIIYARGINGQYIFVIPSKNMVVVRLGNKRSHEYVNGHPRDMITWLDAAFDLVD